MGDRAGVVVAPITPEDVSEVAEFLHRELNPRISAAGWARSMVPPWSSPAPNHGFHLRAGDEVVGAALAFYSERDRHGSTQLMCNLGAWCVSSEHRAQGVRLVRALLSQRGYHFTDLSPSGNVVALNERLHFEHLDTMTALMPNVPWPSRGVRVVTAPARIRELLTGDDLRVFDDHLHARAVHHVLLLVDDRPVHVMVRRDRRKGAPIFASVLHVSEPALLGRAWGRLRGHLLVRFGVPFTLAELRVVDSVPPLSTVLRRSRPKMYRSSELGPSDVDYLYSELTCVAW